MFEGLRKTLARWIAPATPAKLRTASRMYAMGKPGRTTSGWGPSLTSEDNELQTSLRTARNRARALIRDAAYAKRAKVIVQNNVIGSGIGFQAKVKTTRDAFHNRVNDEIEAVWKRWSKRQFCHKGQALPFSQLERHCMGQVFETGEIFLRKHFTAMPGSPVPFHLEIIEPERIAEDVTPGPGVSSNSVRLGVEVDQYGAAVAYFVRTPHPGDLMLMPMTHQQIERVPADQMFHIRIIDRWPQTRAIPWMHAAARKLNDMDGLTEAEITAARAAACYMGFVEPPPDNDSSFDGDPNSTEAPEEELEPAMIRRLNPGEKFSEFAPNRPNAQLDPFMRMMLREVAAGVGCSYEGLSRDYSQSNYSSSRLALLDDRDLWKVLQAWWICSFREELHSIWLQQAVLAGAITSIGLGEYGANPEKFEAVCYKPRGWGWVDPAKEVNAYKEAVRCGFTTLTDVIAQTGNGRDFYEILEEREQELTLMEEKGLVFDTDPAVPSAAKQTAQNPADAPLPAASGEGDGSATGDAIDPTVQTAEKMLRATRRTHA